MKFQPLNPFNSKEDATHALLKDDSDNSNRTFYGSWKCSFSSVHCGKHQQLAMLIGCLAFPLSAPGLMPKVRLQSEDLRRRFNVVI